MCVDFAARHKQLLKLINEGIIRTSGQDVGSIYAVEQLRSIWIGGLFNPKALTTALMHEKAIQEDLLYDDVRERIVGRCYIKLNTYNIIYINYIVSLILFYTL